MNSPMNFRGYAFLVGVSRTPLLESPNKEKSSKPLFSPLLAVNQDITDLTNLLEGAGYKENVLTLKDYQATDVAISEHLDEFIELVNTEAEDSSVVFIYLSGHGYRHSDGKYYLLTHNTQYLTKNSLKINVERCLSADQLVMKFEKILTPKVIVMVNSCFSADLGNSIGQSDAETYLKSFETNHTPKERAIIASSTNESYIKHEDHNSVFVKHLLRTLKTDTGIIEVFKKLSQFIQDDADLQQCPVFVKTRTLTEASNFPMIQRMSFSSPVEKKVTKNETHLQVNTVKEMPTENIHNPIININHATFQIPSPPPSNDLTKPQEESSYVHQFHWLDPESPANLQTLECSLPTPLPIAEKEDMDTTNPLTQSWLTQFQETLDRIKRLKGDEWIVKRLKNLGIGLRGLDHFCQADALLFVPPLINIVQPLQEALKHRKIIGIFGRSGSGKSKLSIYLAYWWHKVQRKGPVYYVKDPRSLTEADWQFLLNEPFKLASNVIPLLILEDLHNIQETNLRNRILNLFKIPRSSQTWVILGSYTLPPDREPRQDQEIWIDLFRVQGEICLLDNIWNDWRPYFYPWLTIIAKLLDPITKVPTKWQLKKCATPWHYLVALGLLDEEFQKLQTTLGTAGQVLYGLLAWGYLCTAEQGLSLSTIEKLVKNRTEVQSLFEKATVGYYGLQIKQKAQGDPLIEQKEKKNYKKYWFDLYINKRIEDWQQPGNDCLRLLPSLGAGGKVEFFHSVWADKVLKKLLLETEPQKYLNFIIGTALSSLKQILDECQFQENIVEWTSRRVKIAPREDELEIYSLDFASIKLSSLPESLLKLTGLQTLDLAGNQLKSLPENFGNLRSLQTLWLQGNQLKSLPESFGGLVNLKELQLYNNQLKSLPESFSNLGNLKELWLYSNQLKSLPESFDRLTNLKELSLSNNKLSTLPESFSNLSNLKELWLYSNQLKSLPESFGNLRNLQKLWLYDNLLKSLPETFGQLQNLQRLDLEWNQLKSLPESLKTFFRELKAKGCEIYGIGHLL